MNKSKQDEKCDDMEGTAEDSIGLEDLGVSWFRAYAPLENKRLRQKKNEAK